MARVFSSASEVDSTFSVRDAPGGEIELFIESRSGGRGSGRVRNSEYERGFDILLDRMRGLRCTIEGIALAPTRRPVTELTIPGRNYPISMASIEWAHQLRMEIGRVQASTNREVGVKARGGNHTKRIKLSLRLDETMSAADLEGLLAGGSFSSQDVADFKPSVGVTYRDEDEAINLSSYPPSQTDAALVQRGIRAHRSTQRALKEHLLAIGLQPLSKAAIDPAFDIAWLHHGTLFVAEVKSVCEANMDRQLRLGLGQVLWYAHNLERRCPVQPVLVAEGPPPDDWIAFCRKLGVLLTWPEMFTIHITNG